MLAPSTRAQTQPRVSKQTTKGTRYSVHELAGGSRLYVPYVRAWALHAEFRRA